MYLRLTKDAAGTANFVYDSTRSLLMTAASCKQTRVWEFGESSDRMSNWVLGGRQEAGGELVV